MRRLALACYHFCSPDLVVIHLWQDSWRKVSVTILPRYTSLMNHTRMSNNCVDSRIFFFTSLKDDKK